MATNIFGGRANSAVARSSKIFSEIPELDSDSVSIIYEIGDTIKSWVPDRGINPLSGFEENKGYYIVAKTDLDLSTILSPPDAVFNTRAYLPGSLNFSWKPYMAHGVDAMNNWNDDVLLEFDVIVGGSGDWMELTPAIGTLVDLFFTQDYIGKPLRYKVGNGPWIDRVFSGIPAA